MTYGRGKPQASRRELSRLISGFALFRLALLPEVPVDRSAGETVEDDATQELRVRTLNLLGLKRDVARKPDGELHGAGFPRTRRLARSHSVISSIWRITHRPESRTGATISQGQPIDRRQE